jgi:hypothetical protein
MIQLLRDFNDVIFTKHPSEDLHVKDKRLTLLDGTTKDKIDMGVYDFM